MSKNLWAKYYWENKLVKDKKKQLYDRECYKNLSVDEKQQKLVEYRKKYRIRKNATKF